MKFVHSFCTLLYFVTPILYVFGRDLDPDRNALDPNGLDDEPELEIYYFLKKIVK